eukprot:jgi/Mesvir1/6474/Mv19548-RA.1
MYNGGGPPCSKCHGTGIKLGKGTPCKCGAGANVGQFIGRGANGYGEQHFAPAPYGAPPPAQYGYAPPPPAFIAPPPPVYGAPPVAGGYPAPGAYPPPVAGGYPPAAAYPPPVMGTPVQPPAYGAPPGVPPTAPAPAYPMAPPVARELPPPAVGQKKALLVGINYFGTRMSLQGCINDTKYLKYCLMKNFGFPESNILTLTEEERDPLRKPTRHNMLQAMHWLVMNAQPGDSLVFQFSGHGSQVRDYTGDETDGYDEVLIPLDYDSYRKRGHITDDEVNAYLVNPLPPGVRLHAIIDACHSGTAMDLPYRVLGMDRQGRMAWQDEGTASRKYKGTRGGAAYCFSGCGDDDVSADTSALSKVASTGAMTYCFVEAVEKHKNHTYNSLLAGMRAALTTGRRFFTQVPQLSSSHLFDLNVPFYL